MSSFLDNLLDKVRGPLVGTPPFVDPRTVPTMPSGAMPSLITPGPSQPMSPLMPMQPPDLSNQNVFLPQPGTDSFLGRHPRVTRSIEDALMVASAMQQTPETAGQAISMLGGAILGLPQQRQQRLMQQAMAPYQWQRTALEMQKAQAEVEDIRNRGEYYKAHGDYMRNMPKVRDQQSFERMIAQARPTGAGWEVDPGEMARAANKWSSGEPWTEEDYGRMKNIWKFNAEAAKKAPREHGGSLPERLAAKQEEEQVAAGGSRWDANKWSKTVIGISNELAGGKAANTTDARTTVEEKHGKLSDVEQKKLKEVDTQYPLLNAENKETRKSIRRGLINKVDDPTKLETAVDAEIERRNAATIERRKAEYDKVIGNYRRSAVAPKRNTPSGQSNSNGGSSSDKIAAALDAVLNK